MTHCLPIRTEEKDKGYLYLCARPGCWMNSRGGLWVPKDSIFRPGRCNGNAIPGERTDGACGTKLRELTATLGMKETSSCACAYMAALMDGWGISGCRIRRPEIIEHLQRAYTTLTREEIIEAVKKSLTTGLALRLNPFDLCGSLLDEAIRQAEIAANHPPALPASP